MINFVTVERDEYRFYVDCTKVLYVYEAGGQVIIKLVDGSELVSTESLAQIIKKFSPPIISGR